ncbi:hypothetical protein ABIB00_002154 [Bradyrhizobium sp. LB14.3]
MHSHVPIPQSIASRKETALRKIMQRDRRVLTCRAYGADEERRAKISAARKATRAVPPAAPRSTADA